MKQYSDTHNNSRQHHNCYSPVFHTLTLLSQSVSHTGPSKRSSIFSHLQSLLPHSKDHQHHHHQHSKYGGCIIVIFVTTVNGRHHTEQSTNMKQVEGQKSDATSPRCQNLHKEKCLMLGHFPVKKAKNIYVICFASDRS